jgi:CubicO group peptidase (beta-lactamase class C family)
MRSLQDIVIAAVLLALMALLCRCASDSPFKIAGPTTPAQLDDGWEIATPGDVGIDPAALDKIYAAFVSEDRYYNAKSLLVVKNGKLVFETYCRDPKDRDRYGHVQSVTKSVTSLVSGIVESEGYIDSLDTPLYSIMPENFPSDAQKRSITLRHLLTMTSGLSFDNSVFAIEMYVDKPVNPVKYILSKPLYAQPGQQFNYRDCDPELISYAIQHLTGKTEEQWARERIFTPLGIRNYYWELGPAGVTTGATGLHLKPRDMAKLGQLVLDHGRWNGQEIVDSTWVAESTRAQVATPYLIEPHVYEYGYLWWILPRRQAFTAWGHGGNFICVVPDREMVIVMTSMPDVDDETVGTKLEAFDDLIGPLLE